MPTRRTLLTAAAMLPALRGARAEPTNVIRIGRIQGINFLPTHVMQKRGLVEKHAAKLGVPGGRADWRDFPGGGGATDAMLSGNIDVVNAGPGNLLLLWDRTKGGVKGIVANAALPASLVTRDANLRTLTDYGPGDKIALPTVLVSTQAILLQIACGKLYGPDEYKRLNSNTVQMGHADGYIALRNPLHEVHSHFTSPPFISRELRDVPGAHIVTTSSDILGSPLSTAINFATTKYTDAEPGMVQALIDASAEAVAAIRDDPAAAARDYLDVSNDKMPQDELVALLKDPDMVFETRPQGTEQFADFLHRAGTIRTKPARWTDYFVPQAAKLAPA